MHIIFLKNGYVVTDGISSVHTFMFTDFPSRHECLVAAATTAFALETIWGNHQNIVKRGKLVKRAGIVYERPKGR